MPPIVSPKAYGNVQPMPIALPKSPTGESAKRFGAYYTDAAVAAYLVGWALRDKHDTVVDPSFGGGVFLRAAYERLLELGGDPSKQVFGIELDSEVHQKTSAIFSEIQVGNLISSDFFDIEPQQFAKLDAVVGNPPFIRFQRFSGEARAKALARAAAQGVGLSKLASSWAAFVVHATALLKVGGRLAMVIPAELGHASYAQPVLEFLLGSFAAIQIIRFKQTLFPEISQDTVLLLCEGREGGGKREEERGRRKEERGKRKVAITGSRSSENGNRETTTGRLELLDLDSVKDLVRPHALVQPVNVSKLLAGEERLIEYHLSPKLRGLYSELQKLPSVVRLGELAYVGIGYVTGNNEFFHLSPEQVQEFKIPKRLLKLAVRRGRALRGLQLTQQDWQEGLASGLSGYLLAIPPEAKLSKGVMEYLEQGQQQNIHQAYKCRVRQPWYSVPQVQQPDAFLSYMSGTLPHWVANTAGVVAPNSLLGVRLNTPRTALALAAAWQTSLTHLSAELSGHPMGGGMLKIEPSEAEKILLAMGEEVQTSPVDNPVDNFALELDFLLRKQQLQQATDLANQRFLIEGLGLSKSDCVLLQEGVGVLQQRRR